MSIEREQVSRMIDETPGQHVVWKTEKNQGNAPLSHQPMARRCTGQYAALNRTKRKAISLLLFLASIVVAGQVAFGQLDQAVRIGLALFIVTMSTYVFLSSRMWP
jgi:hypothetical protein